MLTRLERSTRDKMIAGVCGGIAEYLQVEVTWVRLSFVILGIFGGAGIVAYIVLAIIMPLPGQRVPAGTAAGAAPASEGTGDAPDATGYAPVVPEAVDMERRRQFAGYALIAVGAIFLLGNQGLFRLLDWRTVWPLALVLVGSLLLLQRLRR